jgi:hypothetical protein
MQRQNPTIVRTAAQPTSSIGDRMGDMRVWLDRNHVTLRDFKLVTLSIGTIVFDAQFSDLGHAALFHAAFGSPAAGIPWAPTVRRRLSWWHRRAA